MLTPKTVRSSNFVGILVGPLAAGITFILLTKFSEPAGPQVISARLCLAVGAWMAIWWITEAIPLSKTALIPLVIFPILSVRTLPDVMLSYVHPLIFLFLGGFIISIALQKWSLDSRFAWLILRTIGARRNRLVAGVMLATASLSMWISNTATTIMMLPIALSLISASRTDKVFSHCLLLAVAYGASIGGIATIIGTPPNTFVASYIRDALAIDVGFIEWMAFGLPLAMLFLGIAWAYLVYVRYPQRNWAQIDLSALSKSRSKLEFAHLATIFVFSLVALLWLSRRWLNSLEILDLKPFATISDAKIAMAGAALLLLIPARKKGHRSLLAVRDLKGVPWDTLILFGGGLALANAIKTTGADQLIGTWISALPPVEPLMVLACIVMFIVFATELTSNIATTATLVPILAASAQIFGMEILTVVVATAFSASCAFMLPVATPPNAIVYGSGKLPAREMARAGFGLNLIGILLITLTMHYLFSGF